MNWLERLVNGMVKEESKDKMLLKSRDMGNGKYEVGGIVFYADSHQEALRKYRKGKSYETKRC
jgi:hypothetical protein